MSEWDPVVPYQRVVDALRARIESGGLPPGAQIPSNAALAKDYDVSPTTVQRAIRALKSAGLVETKLGLGVFVREAGNVVVRSSDYTKAPTDGTGPLHGLKSVITDVREIGAPVEIAKTFGFEAEMPVLLRQRTMTLKDVPVELVSSYYPLDVARGTELASRKPLKDGSPAALERLGVRATHCVELVSTRMPTPAESRTLRIGPGVPVFRLLRTVFEGDRPVEVLDMVMEGGRTQLRYEMPIEH